MSINICVIGLGTVGKKRFEIFNDHSDVDEVSFFDPKIKKFYNIHSFNNISEIFSNSNIDAIAICTPNQQKIGLIEKAYKSKKFPEHIENAKSKDKTRRNRNRQDQ